MYYLRASRLFLCALSVSILFAGCAPADAPQVTLPRSSAPIEDLDFLQPSAVGQPVDGHPWITHVIACDLDQDGRMDILACDAQTNEVVWLRQDAAGRFTETVIASGIPGPVHVEVADMDGDGDLDILVASMGRIFPNNDLIGSVIVLENDGAQNFTPRILLENVARVTDVRAADLSGNGQMDLAVAQFGYEQGEVRWMERTGPWSFRSHLLLELSGSINVCIDDMDGDGTPDLVVLVSQQWEEIHLFTNDGAGGFSRRKIYGSTNSDYGSSGISLADLNGNGRPDVLYTNGDGFDYATPGPRPWHGVQWLENQGNGFFRYHRIADFPGAHSPVGVDMDGDGNIDVLAVSAFADWENPGSVSLMLFSNEGGGRFTPRVLARTPTHLVSVAAADLDGDGIPEAITGGFHAYPPYDAMSRITVWRQKAR